MKSFLERCNNPKYSHRQKAGKKIRMLANNDQIMITSYTKSKRRTITCLLLYFHVQMYNVWFYVK